MRLIVSAVIYPIVQSVLFGVGLVSASLLVPPNVALLHSLASVAIAAWLFAVPISWGLSPRLMSPRDE